MNLVRRARSWAAEQSRWVQYPPERQRLSVAAGSWFMWLSLQMVRAWLLIVGGAVIAGMLYVAYCFAWALWKFG